MLPRLLSLLMKRDLNGPEARWREAIALLGKDVAQADVARRVGVFRASVCNWAGWRKSRRGAAWKRGRMGRPLELTAEAHMHMRKAPEQGAQAHGFATDMRTLPRIAAVLARVSGVELHRAHLNRVLGKMGWNAQRPEERSLRRDEKAIQR